MGLGVQGWRRSSYNGYFGTTRKFEYNYMLENIIVVMSSSTIMVLWLDKRTFLFLEATCRWGRQSRRPDHQFDPPADPGPSQRGSSPLTCAFEWALHLPSQLPEAAPRIQPWDTMVLRLSGLGTWLTPVRASIRKLLRFWRVDVEN